jgi:hypothetical protein
MKRLSASRMLFTFVFASSMPIMVIAGCKKPPPPAPDAEPPPAQVDSGPMILAPLDDDAGADADADAAKPHWTGPGMNPNEAKVRACCSRLQMAITAAGVAATPEMKALLGQCNGIAAAVHTNPNAPELSGLKAIPGCQ